MPVITINSDYKIGDIENHFKVSAGPGAGKTYWLVNHIKNILHNSKKLSITKKVACITYTNIAVETILNRLGTSSEQVEVSTIHSFIYKHILKPYASFIAEEYTLDVRKIDGHDEIRTSFKKINDWIEHHPNVSQLRHPYTIKQLTKLESNKDALTNWLNSIRYILNPSTKEISMNANRLNAFYLDNSDRRYLSKKCLDTLEMNIIDYKKLYWSEGKISHDDVLFLGYQIIKKFPFVVKVLTAKFPYIVIDEFQDSNPIQIEFFKLLGLEASTIGVIGDSIQSIYGFQGADSTQFDSFMLPNITEYVLKENRRSSNEIIDVLNHVRNDITQSKQRDISNGKPIIFVGNMTLGLKKAKIKCGAEVIYTLSRNNITSNAMKAEINGIGLDSKLLEKLSGVDSNNNRKNLIYSCIRSIAYAKENKFKDSIKELEKFFNYRTDKIKGKRKALKYITILLEKYDKYKNGTLLEFSQFVEPVVLLEYIFILCCTSLSVTPI